MQTELKRIRQISNIRLPDIWIGENVNMGQALLGLMMGGSTDQQQGRQINIDNFLAYIRIKDSETHRLLQSFIEKPDGSDQEIQHISGLIEIYLPHFLRATSYESKTEETYYAQLSNHLEAGNWKEADRETVKVILKITNQEEEGWLRTQDIDQFPCSELLALDELWTRYSQARFGFSVQRQIWRAVAGQPGRFDVKNFSKFGDQVGWRVAGDWLRTYDQFIFTAAAPAGHLPTLRLPALENDMHWWGAWRDNFKGILSRLEVCLSELISD